MTAAPSLAPAQVRPELTARPVARLQRCGGTTCPPGTCGHDDEPKVARFATGAGPTRAPAIVGSVLAAAGRPLSGPVRTTMEARFGHDFSRVRVHTDATAASSARAVHALAYTVGSDIAFDAGRYAPDTAAGQRLLAHELAHVVQQRSTAPADLAGLTVSQASDPAEAEAARTAGRATPDEAAPPSVHAMPRTVGAPIEPIVRTRAQHRAHGGSGAPRLQRFASTEHVAIGASAAPGQTATIYGYPTSIPIGELIAMAGDYFESLQQLQDLARSGPAGVAEIDCARHKVTGGACTDPAAEARVNARYEDLAARNWTHFSTGSPTGQSNREMYIDYHARAIRSAWLAGASPLTVQPYFPDAIEGFGLHYLTDAFSAGHVRTPRGELRTYWNGLYPNFSENLMRMIACHMASYVRDEEHLTTPVAVLVSGVHVWPVDVDGFLDAIRARAGARLANFGIGDIISMAMHDADNAGLDVVSAGGPTGSPAGPYHWRAIGDNYLNLPASTATPRPTLTGATPAPPGPTATMVVEAVQRSVAEVRAARSAGTASHPMPSTSPSAFTALQLIPQADPASTTNPTYAWRVPTIRALPALTQSIIADEFHAGQQVANQLAAFAIPDCISQHHAGSAWRCFLRVLNADPFEMLARACEGTTCPPGNNNPCTAPREPLVPAGACP